MNTKLMNKQRQRGAALAVSLIVLLVMTLVVLSSSQTVVMQERMTSAVRDGHMSLAAAEAGVTAAESYLDDLTSNAKFETTDANTGVGGLWSLDNAPADYIGGISWTDNTKIRPLASDGEAPVVVNGATANYVIMHLGTIEVESLSAGQIIDLTGSGYGSTLATGEIDIYQIIARATGRSGTAERFVVTNYGKLY